MSGYTARSAGTTSNGTTVTPGIPGSMVNGDLELYAVQARSNADTFTTPSGWTLLSPAVNDAFGALFGRIADGSGADTPPSVAGISGSQLVAQCMAFGGNVFSPIASIVHASVDQTGAGVGTGGNSIQYSALTISVSSTLIIAIGGHNKTGTSDGSSVDDLAGFTTIGRLAPNGTRMRFWWGYQQQTTGTSLSSVQQTCSGTAEALQQQSIIVSLKSLITFPPGQISRWNNMANL